MSRFLLCMILSVGLCLLGGLVLAQSDPQVNPTPPAGTDQNNASVAWSDFTQGEAYAVYSDFFAPMNYSPTQVWYSYTTNGGGRNTWTDAVKPPALGFSEEWNPWVSAIPAVAAFPGYIMVSAQRALMPWVPAVPCAIVADYSQGGGMGFNSPAIVVPNVVGDWLDYPVVEVDDEPMSPSVAEGHVVWTQWIDGNGGDMDGNGNHYDEAGDVYAIWTASTGFGGPGPAPLYPAFTTPVQLSPYLPVFPNSMGSHRAALDIVGPNPTPLVPPGGVYVAYFDWAGANVTIDANPVPGLGAGWFGPNPVMPLMPGPPVINPGMIVSHGVTIAVDNSGAFPGRVYLAWNDYNSGSDYDIWFAHSIDGGATFVGPIRANQDPMGNMADQWAPHMRIDEANGTIIITYYDRRNDPTNTFIEVWESISNDGGLTWVDNFVSRVGPAPPISNVMIPPIGPYLGDYLGSDWHRTGGPAKIWNDGRDGIDHDIFFRCCVGIRGNVNCDPNQNIDISDLTLLVNYLFVTFSPLCCTEEADINNSGTVDISDLTAFVNHLFVTFQPLPPC